MSILIKSVEIQRTFSKIIPAYIIRSSWRELTYFVFKFFQIIAVLYLKTLLKVQNL
jgi:hypothetical protein